MSIDTNRNANCTSEAEVGQLDHTVIIDKKILWLQVAVNNTSLMAEAQSLANLKQMCCFVRRFKVTWNIYF